MKDLMKFYSDTKPDMKKRLKYFKNIWKQNNKRIFEELVFCIFTPQTSARAADKAIKTLKEKNLLYSGSWQSVSKEIPFVRFRNTKAKRLIIARKQFIKNNKIILKQILKKEKIEKNHLETRNWLFKNINGYGLKEASHFLRNIGFYKKISILDRHILKNMVIYNIIKEIPKSITKKKYLELEEKLFLFCKKNKIKPEEIDILFWSKETGEIFK